jgi:GrpB-like predicted nucleotidyltransferase (UPF0157 family)
MTESQTIRIAKKMIGQSPLEFYLALGYDSSTNAGIWDTFFLYNQQPVISNSILGGTKVCKIGNDKYEGKLIFTDLLKANPFEWGAITKV